MPDSLRDNVLQFPTRPESAPKDDPRLVDDMPDPEKYVELHANERGARSMRKIIAADEVYLFDGLLHGVEKQKFLALQRLEAELARMPSHWEELALTHAEQLRRQSLHTLEQKFWEMAQNAHITDKLATLFALLKELEQRGFFDIKFTQE